jgi:type I restriction enzyme S subunit
MSDHSLILKSPPRGWTLGNFSDICERVQDAASPSANGQRLYLGLEHLASGQPCLVGRGKESDVTSGKSEFRKGDVLFGKLRPYLRKSALAPENGICSTDILVFRATPGSSAEFLCLLTHTDEFVAHAKATTSGVQHPRTSWAALRDFKLHIPPEAEQREIVGVLGIVQRAMEQQERLLALTAELKKALLHQLFTNGFRHESTKQTELGLIPRSWDVVNLGSIATAKGGFGFPLNKQGKKIGNFPFFKVSDMNLPGNEKHMIESNNWIDAADLVGLKAKTCPKDTIIFPKIGATILTNKKRLLTRDSVVDNNVMAVVVQDERKCRPEFLYQWFQTIDLGKLANPGTVPSIASTRLHATLFPLPKSDEQDEMCAAFVALDQKRELHTRKHATLSALFRTLLHELMTARIRVHNFDLPELEAASRE